MADKDTMVEHHASVMVNAPVHQVYSLFTHFNDFPKFMSFVKEVTYYDDQRSHWVAEVVGQHQWDAVNENWVEDRQIAWRSYNGMENAGKVTFQPADSNQTRVDVFVDYNPPAGVLGAIGEKLGAGSRFENNLQHDLNNFARMVDQTPQGALDPESSNYLFHGGSAAAKGTTTDRQDATMGKQPDVGSSTTTTPGGTYNTGTPYNRDVTSSGTGGGITVDRPSVMDQDIVNEPASGTGTQDSGMNRNPVMPPDRGSTGTRDTVIPPDTNNADPNAPRPPMRDTNTGTG
jgi:uncharacterized membrane protein